MSDPSSPETCSPTPDETRRRDQVIARVLDFIQRDEKIRLPAFDPKNPQPGQDFALQAVVDNDFSGSLGPHRYQLEGEDDLLHLIVVRADGLVLTPENGRQVAQFVLTGVQPAKIWLKPGQFSQHFYFGHEELLNR